MVASTWDGGTKAVTHGLASDAALSRFTTRFESIGTPVTGVVSFGIAANQSMPGLPGPAPLTSTTSLPVPVMLTLAQCPFAGAPSVTLPSVAQPAVLDPFPRILHVEMLASRTVGGVPLPSGMETAVIAATAAFPSVEFPAAIPTQPRLVTPAGTIALDGPKEAVDAGPATGSFTLEFSPEAGTGLRADYYDVTLHKLAGGTLTAGRVFTVTEPKVQLDSALFAPGATYVFQIRSFSGHPNARQGDFRPVAYPYGSAILYTRTFTTR